MINIVFITDKNYVFPTKVAVKSIIANKNKETKYNINIIGVELDENDVFLFKNLETDNIKINIIQKDNDYSNIGFEHQYVSKAALFKFQIPNIFSNLDKILYLDGDIIIKKDLTELYNTDLCNCYSGMVIDYNVMHNVYQNSKKHYEVLELDNYFNSGVILFNIKQCLQDNITDKLFKEKNNDKICKFMDQDCFNIVFKNRVKLLDLQYNFFPLYLTFNFDEIKSCFKLNVLDFNELLKQVYIIHFAGYKPWNNADIIKADEFWKYADNIDIIKNIESLNKKIFFLEEKSKLPKWLGNLICGFILKKENRHNFREKYVRK